MGRILIFILIQITQVVARLFRRLNLCHRAYRIRASLRLVIICGNHDWFLVSTSGFGSSLQGDVGEGVRGYGTPDKYVAIWTRKTLRAHFLWALVLPGFPDDFLCMVAGLSPYDL